jgi:hypothetical protein
MAAKARKAWGRLNPAQLNSFCLPPCGTPLSPDSFQFGFQRRAMRLLGRQAVTAVTLSVRARSGDQNVTDARISLFFQRWSSIV